MDEPRSEFFANAPIDIEREEEAGLAARKGPWDPLKIRVTTKPWSIRQAIDDIADKTIDLAPDFQRPSVWDATQRSQLIESILLGIPLPALYFSADAQGLMQVVDGVQRLSAINDFATNRLQLTNLEHLQISGSTFAQLDAAARRRFHQTQLLVNVIEPETPIEVKFNIFKRINTGGEPLTSQEIRHALSGPRSRDLLKRMTSMEIFHQATGGAFRPDPRMDARDLALRFIALRLDPELIAYEDAKSVEGYLMSCSRSLDNSSLHSDEVLAELEADFASSMTAAATLFGARSFRKWPSSSERRSPLNRALFESWSVALAEQDLEVLRPRQDAIVHALREAFENNDAYIASISNATSDVAKVRYRLEVARSLLAGVTP